MSPSRQEPIGATVQDRARTVGAPLGRHGAGRRWVVDRPIPRILAVAPQPFYQDRGTPIALRQVLQALSELGRPVDLVTYPVGEDVALPGLRIFRSANPLAYRSVPVGFSLRKVVLDLPLTAALSRRLARGRYTCIHAVEEAAFPAALLAEAYRTPLLYDMQSSLAEQLARLAPLRLRPARAALNAAERWLLRRSSLVATSAGLAERVREAAPTVPVREWHFPSAPAEVNTAEVAALRARLGLSPGQPVVLYSGTFEEYQGLAELIAAIPLVHDRVPAVRFVLVGAEDGDTPFEDGAGMALAESGILRVVERQPRADMAAFLALADVLVSARAYGGNLPLKIFDYLAAGRPIVATDIPTHRTVLSEERAVLVQPTAEALAAGIIGVLGDPTRAGRLAAAARSHAQTHFGWNRFVDSVDALYAEVEQHAHVAR
jgi:glycosyltransferase involved in cell wall biosynthesis